MLLKNLELWLRGKPYSEIYLYIIYVFSCFKVSLKFWRISLARSVKFEVFGQEYSLNTEAPEEDVQEILEMVRVHLYETCKSSSVVPSSKSAILASLNMAGKYVKLKRDFDDYRSEVETLSSQIRKKIEDFVQLS